MSEITESEERLARPLIRLAKLVGVGTSYLGMSHDYHEIDDDVLIEVLAALGIDASSESAQLIAIRRILNERYARLVAPTVLHIAGSEDRVLVNTGILDVPSASITLENGEPYQGTIEVGPGDGSQAYDLDGTFISNAAGVIPADLPIGYHTLHVKVADRVQDATLISAPDRVDLLDPMKGGSLWGWMAQLYSIRSSNSWGVGDYEDLKTMLVDAKQKTGADFVLINPVHAAEPVSPLTPSPYLPVSRRLINFTYIRPEAIAEYATLSEGDKNAVDGLHADTEPLNGDSQLIDRDAMWRSKMHALWIIFKAGRTAERQSVFDQCSPGRIRPLPRRMRRRDRILRHLVPVLRQVGGAQRRGGQLGAQVQSQLPGNRQSAQAVPGHFGLLPLAGMDCRRAAVLRPTGSQGRRHAYRHHVRYGRRRAPLRR